MRRSPAEVSQPQLTSAAAVHPHEIFCACGRHMRTGRGRVEHLHEVGGGARRGERLEHGFEHPRPTEPPEALPDGVPIAKLGRQSPPSDVVNGKIMKRFPTVY